MMTMQNSITIGGVKYPSRMTMGAMLEFRERTGKEITELQSADISLAVTLLYCCIVSASRADGVPIAFASPIEMADHMDANDFAAWQNAQFTAVAGETPGTDASNDKKKE